MIRALNLLLAILCGVTMFSMAPHAVASSDQTALITSDWTWKGREVKAQFLLPVRPDQAHMRREVIEQIKAISVDQLNRPCDATEHAKQYAQTNHILTLSWTCGNARTPISISDPLRNGQHIISITRGVSKLETRLTLSKDIKSANISQGKDGTLIADGSFSAHLWMGLKNGWSETFGNILIITSLIGLYLSRKDNLPNLFGGFAVGYAIALIAFPNLHPDKLQAILAITYACLALLIYGSIFSGKYSWSILCFGAAFMVFSLMVMPIAIFSALSIAFWAGLVLFLVAQGLLYLSTKTLGLISFSMFLGLGGGLSLQAAIPAHLIFEEKLFVTNTAILCAGTLALFILMALISITIPLIKRKIKVDEGRIDHAIRYGVMGSIGFLLTTQF